MKTATTILFALLAVGCSTTWTPKKTVTLHDVDQQMAQSDGTDLRYLAAPAPECKGARGCRDTVSKSDFYVYQWSPICDGSYCGTDELQYVDVAREAARVAFMAEQLQAAQELLAGGDLTTDEQLRYADFVRRAHVELPTRLTAAEAAFEALVPLEKLGEQNRTQATTLAQTTLEHLVRARATMHAVGPAPTVRHASK